MDARVIADAAARELAGAVALVGSVARGEDLPTSDIDLIVLAPGEDTLRMRDGRLVSISRRTPDQVRAAMNDPGQAGGAVPCWREAVPLHDPYGQLHRLQQEANAWQWDDQAADQYVAAQVTGFAEEMFRLQARSGTRMGHVITAVLATRLPMIKAVHERILYGSENRLWDLVAEADPAWGREQDDALRGDPRAAAALYVQLAETTGPLLDAEQRAVVQAAIRSAEAAPAAPGSAGPPPSARAAGSTPGSPAPS